MDNARTLAISRNASALFMAITAASLDRGAKGLDTAWPHTEVDEGADSDDIAGKAYKSATEYFNDLLDIGNLGGPQHRPYIDVAGVEVLGKNAVLNGSVNSAGLDWCIAANIDEDMPDNIPVIVSANFNPALLLSKWDGRSNRSTLLPIGPKSGAERSMFGDKSIIVVYKNGSRKTIKSGSLDYGTLYGQTQFDLTESRHPLVYLTPTGIAEPKGGHPAGNRAAGKNVSTDKNTPVSKRPEERYNAEAELKKALDELDSLSGQDGVKAEVKRIVNKEKTNAARRAQGLPVALHSLQMIFSGNPGTGKAAVAHIVARIFRALGVVEKGQLVKTDRSGMVGGHMGETAKKTAAVCDKAIGGVLFIDNANELCNSDGDDYGREAIATLLKHMEDNRGKMVVIIAGRKDKMLDLLRTYPGLESRFLAKIEFADAPIMD